MACRMSRATATGMRFGPPTLRLVGSKLIQPAPETKTSPQAWVDPASVDPVRLPIGIEEVARDDPGAEAETARRFDEQHGEIPARAPAAIQSFDRRLRAFVFAALIADPSGDAEAEVLEQGERIGPIAADERPRPFRQPSGRIRILLDGQRAEVGPFVVRIAKRIDDRRGRDVEDRPRRSVKLEFHDAVDDQAVGRAEKHRGGDGIAEDVVRPRHLRRRRNGHRARNQPQVAALARTKHQSMRSETDQPPIAVGRPVMDLRAQSSADPRANRANVVQRASAREPERKDALRRQLAAFSCSRRPASRIDER